MSKTTKHSTYSLYLNSVYDSAGKLVSHDGIERNVTAAGIMDAIKQAEGAMNTLGCSSCRLLDQHGHTLSFISNKRG